MAEVIRMPRMSDTMEEGVIVQWLKKEGDKIRSGDILAEVETDKATMELENYVDGVLLHIGVKEGQSVPVDGVLAVVGKEGEDYKALLEGEAGGAKKADKSDADKKEISKADTDGGQPKPADKEDKSGVSGGAAEKTETAHEEKAQSEKHEEPEKEGDRLKASPLARKMAEDKGIPLNEVKGSGDNGRIVRRDVENYQPAKKEATAGASAVAAGEESYEEIPLSQMRKTIARRLGESKFSAPHFYLTIEVDMTRAIEARGAINNFLGTKVSFNDLVLRAAAAALTRHPKVNSSWREDKIRVNKHVHIGVAIAVDEGLVVPVIRFANTKNLALISQEVKQFADKAKSKKLQPADYEGNTFTISNLGMFGIEEFTAIINPPDACIMAVGAILDKPVVKNGAIVPGKVMKVTLSCDHRVVDGASGAEFLQTFKSMLEEPVNILA